MRENDVDAARRGQARRRTEGEAVNVALILVACLAPISPFLYALVWGRW